MNDNLTVEDISPTVADISPTVADIFTTDADISPNVVDISPHRCGHSHCCGRIHFSHTPGIYVIN